MAAMYLTQEEYTAYGGKEMDIAAYTRLEYAARKKIDRVTFQRVQAMAEVPEAVKRLMYELISIEGAAGVSEGIITPAISSFSTDGYSEYYQNTRTKEYVADAENTLIYDYLSGERDDSGVPLLYMGVDICSCATRL